MAVGNLTKKAVEDFAGDIHPEVRGNFIHAQGEVNFEFGKRSMCIILSDWYQQIGHTLLKQVAIEQLASALENTEMTALAFKLRQISLDLNVSDSQSTTGSVKSKKEKGARVAPQVPHNQPARGQGGG